MTLTGMVGAVAVLTALAFVLEPLLRSEADVEPLDRPRPGVRDLVGSTVEPRDGGPAPSAGRRRCHACDRDLDPGYDFCDRCLRPLP